MKTIYLKEFKELVEKEIAFIPLGTVEWHGNYLPIETDFLVADKICQDLAKNFGGYVLPPFYMGGYSAAIIDGVEMRGMDKKLGKKLYGSVYFLESDLFVKILSSLIDNLKQQGFKKIVLVTGHGGDSQEAALKQVEEKNDCLVINPYDGVSIHHADEGEISIFWACYPEEEQKARSAQRDEDLTNYYSYDPIEKSSLALGNDLLGKMLELSRNRIKNN